MLTLDFVAQNHQNLSNTILVGWAIYYLSFFHETKHLNYHAKTLASICLVLVEGSLEIGGVERGYENCIIRAGAQSER